MDHSLAGSSIHGISQARVLELVPMFSTEGSSQQGSNPGLERKGEAVENLVGELQYADISA